MIVNDTVHCGGEILGDFFEIRNFHNREGRQIWAHCQASVAKTPLLFRCLCMSPNASQTPRHSRLRGNDEMGYSGIMEQPFQTKLYDSADYLDSEEAIVAYLTVAFGEGDADDICAALNAVEAYFCRTKISNSISSATA